MKRLLRFSLILAAVMAGLAGAVSLVVYRVDARNEAALLDTLAGEETQSSRAMAREVAQSLASAGADLEFLAAETTALLAAGRGREGIASLFTSFARSHPVYDQIRLLDETGRERVRINHRDGVVTRTAEAALQDKSARDYVKQALALDDHERLVTQVEYNREHGQVELPHLPVGRYIAPVAGEGDSRAGFVVLNQRSTPMFRNIMVVGTVAVGDPHIINGAGNWILESNGGRQAGYRLRLQGSGQDFGARYPAAWRSMRDADAGSIRTAHGLFTHTRLRAAADEPGEAPYEEGAWKIAGAPADPARRGWHLVSHVPQQRLEAMLASVKLSAPRSLALIGGLVIIASLAIALVLERYRRGLAHWRFRATLDPLTGLINREEFNRRLEQALALAARNHRCTAVVFVDLNDFKPLNDSFGHAAGDRALVAVADRLFSACRRTDVVARLGGDEFAIVLWEVSGRRDTARIADKLETAVAQPVLIDGTSIPLTASIGAATYPDDGHTTEALLRRADMKMYERKRERSALLRPAEDAAS